MGSDSCLRQPDEMRSLISDESLLSLLFCLPPFGTRGSEYMSMDCTIRTEIGHNKSSPKKDMLLELK